MLLSGGLVKLLALENETDTGEGSELQVSGWSLDKTRSDGVMDSEWAVTTASLSVFPQRLFPPLSEAAKLGRYCCPYNETLQYAMEGPDVDMRQEAI